MRAALLLDRLEQAETLLKPARVAVLRRLGEPRSCTELAAELDERPQKIYYHVKKLESAGLVERVAERRRRGILEGVYQARARSYWLSPALVGPVEGLRRTEEESSLALLLDLAEELQKDIPGLAATEQAAQSLGLTAEVRVRLDHRDAFLQELRSTFEDLLSRYGEGDGEAFRIALACYPRGAEQTRATGFTLRQHIDAPPERVFEALTRASSLEAWLAEHADVDLDEGRFEFWGKFSPEGKRGRQELVAADRPHRLRFAWTLQGERTEVVVELEPAGAGTRLTLELSGVPPRVEAEPWVQDWWHLALDNLASFVEGRSLGPKVDFTAFAPGDQRVEVDIDALPEVVFRALVEPAQLERWIADLATVEPEVGGRYGFGWDHGPVEILELERAQKLAYSWQAEGRPDTVVSWELEPTDDKTRLTLVHSGFGTHDPGAAGYLLGWAGFVASLKRMVEIGDSWRRIERLGPPS
jgi:uncharacterized protein YndB with AHSA1/START domain/DNA-binding transcriptional ArsR family regulator